jgi:periplasmic protein TonB
MALRCFLFSSDEGTAASIRQILSGLGVEGELCSNAVTAVERITNQSFQIVIIDWDQQPEAGLLLSTARERKASERPITLAIVSDDASAPNALQAGANSLLRKPIAAHQARETLTTARDLLRAKQGSAVTATQAAAAAAAAAPLSSVPASLDSGNAKTLRAGEFLQTPTLAPGGQFETETSHSPEDSLPEPVDPLKDLEPTAASVAEEKNPAVSSEAPGGTRGLQWYLKTRVAAQPSESTASAAAPAPVRGNPELLGYNQSSSYAPPPPPQAPEPLPPPLPSPEPDFPSIQERTKTAELFAYIQEGSAGAEESRSAGSGLGKKAIIGAMILAACAVVAAPQAPWHPKLQSLWQSGKQSVHAWLYPQPVTPVQAPVSHESFTRPGDEYKLPVAETIPDATTDPSQIKVVPVVDPTLKKPNTDSATPDQTAVPADGSTPPSDATPTPASENPATTSAAKELSATPPPQLLVAATAPPVTSAPARRDIFTPNSSPVSNPAASQPVPSQPVPARGTVPPSLKSQMAPASPAVGGNKPLEAALPSIEPVSVPEAAELALVTDQPALAYPNSAKGQQGTVTLQVVIGRDGVVKDAKFLQGSLVFARSAIDGIKQWKFKPYVLNGHPVSVQTQLTLKFKPAQ